MDNTALKVPKTEKQVTLWIHPDGLVKASLFLREQSPQHDGTEQPIDVLNEDNPFVVLHLHHPEQLRFYNHTCIMRVEYQAQPVKPAAVTEIIPCQIHMMDGSIIEGTIRETLPPERARLFDYLNKEKARFIRIYTSDTDVCLINKSYINHVSQPD